MTLNMKFKILIIIFVILFITTDVLIYLEFSNHSTKMKELQEQNLDINVDVPDEDISDLPNTKPLPLGGGSSPGGSAGGGGSSGGGATDGSTSDNDIIPPTNSSENQSETDPLERDSCGYYYGTTGICGGTCPLGNCIEKDGSCFCKL